jgi:citrate synthase
MTTSTLPAPIPGLKGVVVSDTQVGDVRGEEGFYHYRQYSAIELAEQRPFEDVWQLMIDGALPETSVQRDAFVAETLTHRNVGREFWGSLQTIALCGSPLAGLRSALSIVASQHMMQPTIDIDHRQRRADAMLLCSITPTLLCHLHRLRNGDEPIEPRSDLGYAANYLWMMHGVEPTEGHTRAIGQYLISTIDHGFNASTFTARVVASTGADMASCIVAAIGSLSGPLHGGAPSRALALLDEIGTPDRIDAVVRPMIERGDKIMGFGHPVYRTADPRSVMLKSVANRLATDVPSHLIVGLAERIEQRVLELFAELKPGRKIHTNVEFFAGVVMELCAIPRDMFTPTFAASRVVGWCANVLEQANDNKIIRPSARYVGLVPPQAIPVIM